jgi:hypothetical protein
MKLRLSSLALAAAAVVSMPASAYNYNGVDFGLSFSDTTATATLTMSWGAGGLTGNWSDAVELNAVAVKVDGLTVDVTSFATTAAGTWGHGEGNLGVKGAPSPDACLIGGQATNGYVCARADYMSGQAVAGGGNISFTWGLSRSNQGAYWMPISDANVQVLFSQEGGKFAGDLMSQPVPEPETYAMMLAGLAALSFVARRRRPA